MEAIVYTLAILIAFAAAVATAVSLRRSSEGRALELVLVDAGQADGARSAR